MVEMTEGLMFESKITLTDIPIQWIPKFELYYPDLPQFPIVYVHIIHNGKRVYGTPVSASFKINSNKTCDVELLFLSNVNLEKDSTKKEMVKNELENRFGLSDKVGIQDVVYSCKGDKKYEAFFKELWIYVSKVSGDYVPYGKFYEEIYSIVRFVSSWQPKTGRQSEMRMLYNFLSNFGENINITGKWDHLEFFLLPTYDDVKNENFADFQKFKRLFIGMKKIWKIFFTETSDLEGIEIKSMKKSWPQDKDTFIKNVTDPLLKKKKIDVDDKFNIEMLVDAFNRHSWRSAFFIWSIMNIKTNDYREWNKEIFERFYLNENGVGISEKVVAIFLQQGFGKQEIIPIDTWVESFYNYPLGIDLKEDFLRRFDKLGKLERIIWLASQFKKTNIKTFFDMLWCQRYGDTGNNELRGANPISCYECKLRNKCVGFSKVKDYKVLVKDSKNIKIGQMLTKKGNLKGEFIKASKVTRKADSEGCSFICVTENKIPRKVFTKMGKKWKLVDEFSAYILKNQKTDKINLIVSVQEFIESLPSFFS